MRIHSPCSGCPNRVEELGEHISSVFRHEDEAKQRNEEMRRERDAAEALIEFIEGKLFSFFSFREKKLENNHFFITCSW